MKTIKQMKQEIKDKYDAVPERQISTGIYLGKIRTKYIEEVNTWTSTRIHRIPIEEFYDRYM